MYPHLSAVLSVARRSTFSPLLGLTLFAVGAPRAALAQEGNAEAPLESDAASGETPSATPEAPVEPSSEGEAAGGAEVTVATEGGGSLFETAGADTGTSASAGDLSFEVGGYVRGDTYVGVLPGTKEPGINAAYGELSLQPKVKKGDWGSAFADLRLRYGQQLSQYDLFVDLREAYVNAYLGPVDIRLGKQIIAWGRADGFNPTSNLNSVDFRIRSPVEDDRRVGNVAARVTLNLLPVKVEGVWMPLYQATQFPDFTLDPGVRFVDPSYPALALRNGTFAGKVDLQLSSFEASVSYLNGNAPLPGLAYANHRTSTSATVQPAVPEVDYFVDIRRASYRQHVIGFDFATVVGELFGLRGEAAFRSPINRATSPWAPKPDLQWVLGIDREFGNVMIIAQYLGRYTFEWQPRNTVLGGIDDLGNNPQVFEEGTQAQIDARRVTNVSRIEDVIFNYNQMIFNQLKQLQTLASLRIEWKTMQERLSLSALGLVNFSTEEWALFPKINYQITGGISTAIGAEIYMGPANTLFNKISDRLSAGYVELRMAF